MNTGSRLALTCLVGLVVATPPAQAATKSIYGLTPAIQNHMNAATSTLPRMCYYHLPLNPKHPSPSQGYCRTEFTVVGVPCTCDLAKGTATGYVEIVH